MVGAPVDRRAPELDALEARAAAPGLRCGGARCPRGLGEGDVGEGGEDEEREGEGDGDEAAAGPGVGWPAGGEGESGGRHWPGRQKEREPGRLRGFGHQALI